MTKGKWKSPMQQALVEWLTAHPDVSRNELARRAGIDKASVVKIANGEKDNLNGDSAIALSAAMGLSVEDLYAGRATPATAPASAPIAGGGDGGLVMLSMSALTINPLNPRKAFDDEHLAELAESIAAEGVLQNLVVAPAARDGRHVVIAGGRRQRAIMKLVEQGRWAEDAPTIPCRIIAGAEPRVRALALIENLQRVDLTPMEEAEAFAELQQIDPALWTTAHIAETIHRTQRFVQQRLAIGTKLTARAKRALAEGTINVETARALAMAPMKRQAEIVGRIERALEAGYHVPDAAEVREDLTDDWVPIEAAAFDRQLYTGDIVTDDETGQSWFVDEKLFDKLQRQAAAARAAEFEGKRTWVKIVDEPKGEHFSSFDFNTSKKKDLSDTGTIIRITHEHTLEVLDGLTKRELPSAVAGSSRGNAAAKAGKNGKALPIERPDPQPYANSLLVHAYRTKSAALQDRIAQSAFADDGDTAITLAIIGLLDVDQSYVKINTAMRQAPDALQGGHVRTRLAEIFAELKPKRHKSDDEVRVAINNDYSSRVAIARAWEWLRGKTADQRIEIFALLVADQCGYFVGYGKPNPHHEPFELDLAQHVGLDMVAVWRPDDAWLDGSRKARLEAFARAIRLEALPRSTAQLRAAIKARFAEADKPGGPPLPPPAEWVPPEVRILDKAGFAEAFKASTKAGSEPRSPAKKDTGDREGAPA